MNCLEKKVYPLTRNLLQFVALVICVAAVTPTVSAQPSATADRASNVTKGAEVASLTSTRKGCYLVQEDGYWTSVCQTRCQPGYTDRDWDCYSDCSWNWYQPAAQLYCIPDPPPPEGGGGDTGSGTGGTGCGVTDLPPSGGLKSILINSNVANAVKQKSPQDGNVIDTAIEPDQVRPTGAPPLRQLDFTSTNDRFLTVARVYRGDYKRGGYSGRQSFGNGWFSNWDRSIELSPDGKLVKVGRGDGTAIVFKRATDGAWVGDVSDKLSEVVGGDGVNIGWHVEKILAGRTYSVESYDLRGRLKHKGFVRGNSYSLEYSEENDALLTEVRSSSGASINFSYDPRGRVTRLAASSGQVVEYGYDDASQLIDVKIPDGRVAGYDYAGGVMTSAWVVQDGTKSSMNFEYSLHGKFQASIPIGDDQSLWVVPPTNNGQLMRKQTCPAPTPDPCTSTMRAQMGLCLNDADSRAGRRENFCFVEEQTRKAQCLNDFFADPIGGAAKLLSCYGFADFVYNSCIASSKYTQLMDRLVCRGAYPECN